MCRFTIDKLRLPVVCLVAGVLAGLCGCGGGVKVTGTVKYKGQPVDGAELIFKQQGGEGQQFQGVSQDGGKIYVGGDEGLPKGEYEVTIKRWVMRNGKTLPEDEQGEAMKSDGSAWFQTKTYTRDIQSSDPLEFDLDKDS